MAAEQPKTEQGTHTAGSRLAAQRAAKAARKAAKRGRQAELVEGRALRIAHRTTSWFQDHWIKVVSLGAAAAALLVGILLWSTYTRDARAKEGQLLWTVVESARANVGPAPDGEEPGTETLRFETAHARAEATLKHVDTLLASLDTGPVADRARLLAAAAHLELESYKEAAAAYENVTNDADSFARVEALEGLGMAQEGLEQWGEAQKAYQKLIDTGDEWYAPVGRYHLARVQTAQGKLKDAESTLKQLYDEVTDPGVSELYRYTRSRVEARLNELDPSAVRASPSRMDPAELEALIRRVQQQQQQQQQQPQ